MTFRRYILYRFIFKSPLHACLGALLIVPALATRHIRRKLGWTFKQ